MNLNAEEQRLREAVEQQRAWKRWGPYLSERQWGTVREDYSENGSAWDYFPHDQARSRAYRWGEDGLAGFSDDKQRLCFALALWNGNDPILKERLFGLTNSEGNHSEDVKEVYFYLDSTPTHSYMKFLYKYPQAAYPYSDLVQTNRARSRYEMEYELLDTGVFAENRYFDVFVEYAKESPEDVLIRITVANRGPETADIHLLPTLWFRNDWAWNTNVPRPELKAGQGTKQWQVVEAMHATLGARFLYAEGAGELLFTENETNNERLSGLPNLRPYVKDGINEYVVHGRTEAVNSDRTGTKAAARWTLRVEAGGTQVVRLRLTEIAPTALQTAYADAKGDPFGPAFEAVFDTRLAEANAFYDARMPPALSEDERNIMRQALAGMLWSKQYYYFDLDRWLEEHGAHPLLGIRNPNVRNRNWYHMVNDDVISMPDKWEYPWYAAWDLAFHTIALNIVDPDFSRDQLDLMLYELYLHPSGQIPAYEWNFGDVNPPVHAFATLYAYDTGKLLNGEGDIQFLRDACKKLLLNFTWWVNRKDPAGNNVFEGGFLGLDNIGVFDRSAPLPTGGSLEQADGTGWMAFFCLNMLEITAELALHDPSYEDLMMMFMQRFFWIAAAMDRLGHKQEDLWDEEDGFFYDVLRLPDGSAMRLKVHSLVGLLPLCAAMVIPQDAIERFPELTSRAQQFLQKRPELLANIAPPTTPGVKGRRLLSALNESKLRRVLAQMLDEERFFSPYGIRSLSRWHKDHPYVFGVHGEEFRVEYQPAESETGLFGGNSNWRGPIWFPINMLICRALLQYYCYYGNSFTIECPTGSGNQMTLFEVSQELARRLTRIFLRDANGRRPVYGGTEIFQTDPHWRDYILFNEYFHGDNGAGLGASHQTGWTGTVALLIQLHGHLTAEAVLDGDARSTVGVYRKPDRV